VAIRALCAFHASICSFVRSITRTPTNSFTFRIRCFASKNQSVYINRVDDVLKINTQRSIHVPGFLWIGYNCSPTLLLKIFVQICSRYPYTGTCKNKKKIKYFNYYWEKVNQNLWFDYKNIQKKSIRPESTKNIVVKHFLKIYSRFFCW